jgi:molybdopterin-guanine dinucleotide biosynthesis protein B
VLVEGFKREPIPRLEVYRPANGKPALYPQDSGILAVASDVTAPEAAPHWLMLNDTDKIVNWIFDKIYANH